MATSILILSASVGTGHLRAAEAIELALRQTRPEAQVCNVDIFSLATRTFRRCYAQMYLDLIAWAPQLLGSIYNLIDRPKKSKSDHWYRLRVALEKLGVRPFLHLLRSQPWDLVINTFFLPAEIVASL